MQMGDVMKKCYAVLCMCEDLRKGRQLNIQECCNRYRISVATFRRYVALLRMFFWEERQQSIVYDSLTQTYQINDDENAVQEYILEGDFV